MKKRRPALWLIAAALLLALAALLLHEPDDSPPRADLKDVQFPRYMDQEARQRVARRRTLSIARADSDAGSDEPKRQFDPLLAALAPEGQANTAVIIEANALVNSSIGQALLDCVSDSGGSTLKEIKDTLGVDLLTDVDRVAVNDGVTFLSGNFSGLTVEKLQGLPMANQEKYGEHGSIWTNEDGDVMGRWKDELVLLGRDRKSVEASIDRLEAGGAGDPPIGEQETYGEIYGAIQAASFAEVLPPEIAEQLMAVTQRVKIHVDADDDVGIVADIDGDDMQKITDLARSVGGALALGRMDAVRSDRKDMAELLDYAKVTTREGGFRLELALPRQWLEDNVLSRCRAEAQAAGAGTDGGTAP